jgi:hypothetical protein
LRRAVTSTKQDQRNQSEAARRAAACFSVRHDGSASCCTNRIKSKDSSKFTNSRDSSARLMGFVFLSNPVSLFY